MGSIPGRRKAFEGKRRRLGGEREGSNCLCSEIPVAPRSIWIPPTVVIAARLWTPLGAVGFDLALGAGRRAGAGRRRQRFGVSSSDAPRHRTGREGT